MTKYLKNSSKSFSTSTTTVAASTGTNGNSNNYSDGKNVKKLSNNSRNSGRNNKNKSNNNYKSIYSDNHNTSDSNNRYGRNNNGGVCDSVNNKFEYQLSFYGWRKKCLFVLLFMLILLIIINLILTLWILNVMEFSWDGIMGQLKIIAGGGIQLSGQTLILDLLRATILRSKHGQPITIESSNNFTIQTVDQYGNIENLMYLDNKNLEFLVRRNFRIQDQHGQQVFGIDSNEIVIGSNQLRIEGDGGVLINDSIHVAQVRAEAGKKLVLESRLKKLDVKGFQEIFMQSKAGYVDGRILKDIKLHTIAGNIRFDSPNIFMPSLKISQSSTNKMTSSSSQSLSSSLLSASIGSIFGHHLVSGGSGGTTQMSHTQTTATANHHNSNNNNNNNNNYDKFYHKVYQLCSCASGKLFLTSSHTLCSVDDSNVCR